MADAASLSLLAIGREYGVSDDAVRKWIRWYAHQREIGIRGRGQRSQTRRPRKATDVPCRAEARPLDPMMSDSREKEAKTCHRGLMLLDSDQLWRAVEARDPRLDGWVFCGVKTTGIYCRPSCPVQTPKLENVRFFSAAAAAQEAGFRACKRCCPDATPGSPEWDRRADLAGRAMRLIADGVVERDGVSGLARRLDYDESYLHRQLVEVVGAAPLAVARARRAQTALMLLETTPLPFAEVAVAAGFESVRQFNATITEVFAMTPAALRARARQHGSAGFSPRSRIPTGVKLMASEPTLETAPRSTATLENGGVVLRLPYRAPLDADGLIAFLARRAVPGLEEVIDGAYRRSLRLPFGSGLVDVEPCDHYVRATYWLSDLRDLAAAVQRTRWLLDLDSDPQAVLDAFGGDDLIGQLVRAAPGRRVPGHVDPDELAIRAVLGQQVSLAGAATLAERIVIDYGEPLECPLGGVTHLFPSAEAIAAADPARLAMPNARKRAVIGLARALADGKLVLDPGAERDEARKRLLALAGIGPWTAEYISMRSLRDPDAFPRTDLGIRNALALLGHDRGPASATRVAERWRPYRAYAAQHLWAHLSAASRKRKSGRLLAA